MSGEAAPVVVRPLYPRLESDPLQPWRRQADWTVSQRLDHPDPSDATRLVLLDLEGGADGLTFVAAGCRSAHGYGVIDPAMIATALEGVELDFISLRLDAGAEAPAFAKGLADLIAERRLGSASLAVDFGFDPITLSAIGFPPAPDAAAALIALAEESGLAGAPLLADGRIWHEAGANEAWELALVLATATAHLRMLEATGRSLDKARRAIAVLLPFDADVLLGLAKARAVRRLWARLEAACALEPAPLRLHAETSWRMMTRYDPWTNAMRATAATFAAGLGGADTVTVLPMTLPLGLPDEAARRLARNTGRVLLDEANLGKVDDPCAGSGAIEALTDELCRSAWTLFQAIERDGGIEVGLRDGRVQAALAKEAARRRADVESLARGIVGTSRFPRLDAPMPAVLDVQRPSAPAPDNGTLPSRRDSESFEALRDITEIAATGGQRPKVFLAALGEPATFGARVTTAANLFGAAGISTTTPPTAARGIDDLVPAFAKSELRVACLCGDDDAYKAEGTAAVAALHEAGATLVLAMGRAIDGAETFMPDGETTLQVLRTTVEFLCQ